MAGMNLCLAVGNGCFFRFPFPSQSGILLHISRRGPSKKEALSKQGNRLNVAGAFRYEFPMALVSTQWK